MKKLRKRKREGDKRKKKVIYGLQQWWSIFVIFLEQKREKISRKSIHVCEYIASEVEKNLIYCEAYLMKSKENNTLESMI